MAFTKIAAAGIGSTGTVTLENLVVTGSITASLTGTATTTTNIPNLTGAITSNNTTTSLGSFSSANLSAALTDETGSGANVFATSPVLVTPSLGIATAQSLVVSGIITATQLSTGASGTGVNISTDTISGPATLTIDPAAVGDNTGAVRIKGDLYVDGTQFIVNSTTIELADFNVGIASTVGTNALLDGAGIGIGSTGIRKTLTWNNSSTALKSSEDFDISSGKVYRINGTSVLSNNTLGSGVVTSSLTSVGTLGQLQVTGVSTFTNGPILVGSATSTGTASQPLQVTGGAYVSGNLGIGTAIPAKKLHVQTSFVSGAARGGGFTQILFESNQAAATYWEFQANASSTNDILFSKSGTGGSSYGVVGYDHATDALRFYTNSNERLRIDGAGNVLVGSATSTGTASQPLQVTGGAYVSGSVGIGTTNPSQKVHIFQSAANSQAYLHIENNRSRNAAVQFTTTQGFWIIGQGIGSDTDTFMIYDDEARLSVSGTGSRDVTINTGNLVIGTSGKGIDFSATANSSGTMTSELLNDYEEGSFTPSITFNGSDLGVVYTGRTGRYTKIGNRVFFNILLNISNKGTATGIAAITGLPFTPGAGNQGYGAAVGADIGGITFDNIITYRIVGGNTSITLIENGGAGITEADFTNISQQIVSGHYYVD